MPSKGYYPALTGFRALAALLVFAHHYYGHWYQDQKSGIFEYIAEGYVGVTLFFALSGFLITWTYFSRIRAGEIRFFDYWIRRAARILPTYYVLLAVNAGLKGGSITLVQLTLLQPLWESTIFTGISVAWSLTIEECFYLMAPAIYRRMPVGDPKGKPSWRTDARVWGYLLALIVTFFALARGIDWLTPDQGDFLPHYLYTEVYAILGRFGEFAFGVALAVFVLRRPKLFQGRHRAWLPEAGFVFFLASVGLTLFLMVKLKHSVNYTWGIYVQNALPILWIAAAGTAAFIASTLAGSRAIQLLFGNRLVEHLGRASFAFYLLQDHDLYSGVLRLFGIADKPAPSFWLAYLAMNAVASGVYFGVERPAQRWIVARYSGKKRVRARRFRAALAED